VYPGPKERLSTRRIYRAEQGRGIETNMKTIKSTLLMIGAVLLLTAVPTSGQRSRTIEVTNPQLANQVRRELVMLPYYGVFDNLAYSINGSTVTLHGQVVRSSTRSDAARRVKRLSGVSRVVNNIKVLPLSRFDDDIRVATYRSIARMGGLSRYLRGTNPSLHIVVNNGHVTLEGVVSNNSDRDLANMAARRVSGVFSVTNNLRTDRESGIG
jgi:hyperosmotically inducible periplasmic protein